MSITTEITVNGIVASRSTTATMDDPCRDHAASFYFPADEGGDVTERVYNELQDAWDNREGERSVTIRVEGDEITLSLVSINLTPDPAHDVTGNGELSHAELAEQLERRGYEVRANWEDNEHSEVYFDGKHVGDIRGDSVATVTTIEPEKDSEEVQDLGGGFHEASDGTVIYSP